MSQITLTRLILRNQKNRSLIRDQNNAERQVDKKMYEHIIWPDI